MQQRRRPQQEWRQQALEWRQQRQEAAAREAAADSTEEAEDMGHVCRQLVFHSCRGQLQGDTIAFTTKCFHDIIDEIANVNDTPRLPFQVWGVLEPNADGPFQMVDFGPAMALLGLDVTQKQLDLCYARMHEERGLKPPLFTTWKDPKNPSKATKTETDIPAHQQRRQRQQQQPRGSVGLASPPAAAGSSGSSSSGCAALARGAAIGAVSTREGPGVT